MKYAKLSNTRKIDLFQNPLTINGMDIYNPTEAALLAAGYKKYVEDEMDSTKLNLFECEAEYIENKQSIQLVYRYTFSAEKARQYYSRLAGDWMDARARERHYDGIMAACSYATSSNPTFSKEGTACLVWRDAVWEKCHAFLDRLEPDERKIPSEEDFFNSLPPLIWPDEPEKS